MEVGTACRRTIKLLTKKTSKTLDILLMSYFGLKKRLTKKPFKLKKTEC